MTDQRTSSDPDLAAVHAGHVDRLADLDPLVQVPALEADGDVALVHGVAGGAAAVGRIRAIQHGPDESAALWGAARQVRLQPFVVGGDASELEAAWDQMIDAWVARLPEVAQLEPGDRDSAAVLTVPSRDTSAARPLVHHGFAPLLTTAVRVRPGGRSPAAGGGPYSPPPSPIGLDVSVRPASLDDLEVLTELAVSLQRTDARFGMVTERPAAASLLRGMLGEHLQHAPGWTWVAPAAGERPLGFVQVEPPSDDAWFGPLVAARPAAYLASLFVRLEARGTGVSRALVARAHHALDQAGVEATVLHHALPSPTSTPFWARAGYRPLLTTWQRRPALPG